MDIRPIETVYKDHRFRSRLEARWAVFFDALGVRWEYEPEGFDLDGVWYLPDFHVPEMHRWFEIKPANVKLSRDDGQKIERFNAALGASEHPFEPWREQLTVLYGPPYRTQRGEPEYNVGCEPFGPGGRLTLIRCVVCEHWIFSQPRYQAHETAYLCLCCDCGPCRNGSDEAAQVRWAKHFHKGDIYVPYPADPAWDEPLASAYRAAQGARFEHGERGI